MELIQMMILLKVTMKIRKIKKNYCNSKINKKTKIKIKKKIIKIVVLFKKPALVLKKF